MKLRSNRRLFTAFNEAFTASPPPAFKKESSKKTAVQEEEERARRHSGLRSVSEETAERGFISEPAGQTAFAGGSE